MTPYVFLTQWVDEQVFKNWVGSDDFKIAHQNPMDNDAFLRGYAQQRKLTKQEKTFMPWSLF